MDHFVTENSKTRMYISNHQFEENVHSLPSNGFRYQIGNISKIVVKFFFDDISIKETIYRRLGSALTFCFLITNFFEICEYPRNI